MSAVLGVLVLGAMVAGIVAWQRKTAREAAAAAVAGRVLHLRSAAFPATCSWCRNTSVAHKLMVFARTDASWRAFDAPRGLSTAPEHALEHLTASIFGAPHPEWRRFCTERCAREFLTAEHVTEAVAFAPCAYCSTRFPATITRCPHCAAPRTG